jgi:hypothetical protein
LKIITKIKNEVKPLIKENKSKSNVYKKAMYCTNIGRNKIIEKYTLFLPVVINDLKLITPKINIQSCVSSEFNPNETY